MSCLDIFFSKIEPIIGSIDIELKLPKSLQSKHYIFMIVHIKDYFNNFGILQLFSKLIIIVEKIGVISLGESPRLPTPTLLFVITYSILNIFI